MRKHLFCRYSLIQVDYCSRLVQMLWNENFLYCKGEGGWGHGSVVVKPKIWSWRKQCKSQWEPILLISVNRDYIQPHCRSFKHQSLSATTVLFRTTFTRTIILILLKKLYRWLFQTRWKREGREALRERSCIVSFRWQSIRNFRNEKETGPS